MLYRCPYTSCTLCPYYMYSMSILVPFHTRYMCSNRIMDPKIPSRQEKKLFQEPYSEQGLQIALKHAFVSVILISNNAIISRNYVLHLYVHSNCMYGRQFHRYLLFVHLCRIPT